MYPHVTFLLATEDMNIFLVFDRYFKYSIKSVTTEERMGNLANNHVLTLDVPSLPSNKIDMTSTQNKMQAIDVIFKYIVVMLAAKHFKNKFVVTCSCSETTPTQVQEGVAVSKNDLKSSHEEADANIVKQYTSCAMKKNRCIKIICKDTDVFVLLTVYVMKYSTESLVLMEAFTSNRSMVDINKTAKRNTKIVP